MECQIKNLKMAGCSMVFNEAIGSTFKKKELSQLVTAIANLEKDDELVLVKIDRLGRSALEAIHHIQKLQEKGVHVRTLDGLVNTRDLGRLAPAIIGLLTSLAEMDRSLSREKALENIQNRKEAGRDLGGRPKTSPAKEKLVLRLRDEGSSYRSIRAQTGLALSTIRRIIVDKEALAV